MVQLIEHALSNTLSSTSHRIPNMLIHHIIEYILSDTHYRIHRNGYIICGYIIEYITSDTSLSEDASSDTSSYADTHYRVHIIEYIIRGCIIFEYILPNTLSNIS